MFITYEVLVSTLTDRGTMRAANTYRVAAANEAEAGHTAIRRAIREAKALNARHNLATDDARALPDTSEGYRVERIRAADQHVN